MTPFKNSLDVEEDDYEHVSGIDGAINALSVGPDDAGEKKSKKVVVSLHLRGCVTCIDRPCIVNTVKICYHGLSRSFRISSTRNIRSVYSSIGSALLRIRTTKCWPRGKCCVAIADHR